MHFSTIASSLLLAGAAVAQSTPPGFLPAVNTTLDLYFGTQYITPGLMIKKSSAAKLPALGLTNGTFTGKYLLAVIDIDRPNGSKRGTVLHGLLQDFTSAGTTQNGTSLLTTKATTPSSYFGPAPPAETPKHPHNYVFLLHQQPDNFAVPAAHRSVVQSRIDIDWPKFIKDAGLSDPIAANYIQVQSGDNTRLL